MSTFGSRKSVRGSSLEMLVFSLLGTVLAFARSVIIAHLYGATARSDVYYSSMTVVQSPGSLFSDALSALVLPGYHAADDKRRFVTSYSAACCALMGTFCVALGVFRHALVELCFSSFTLAQRDSVSEHIVWGLPLVFCGPLIAVWDNALRGERFFIWGNLGRTINGALALALVPAFLTYGTLGLLAGVSIAVSVNFVGLGIAITRARLLGADVHWLSSLRLMRKSLPILAAGAVGVAVAFLDRHWASGMDVGSVTLLNMASGLAAIPKGLLVSTLMSVYYAFISEAVVKRDAAGLEKLLVDIRRATFGVAALASLLMGALAPWVFAVVYRHGSFDAASIERLAQLFGLLGYGVFLSAIGTVMGYVYYSHSETRLPVANALITSNLIYAVLVWRLHERLGSSAFGMAFLLAGAVNLLLDNWLIQRRFGVSVMRKSEVAMTLLLALVIAVASLGPGWRLLLPASVVWFALVSRGHYRLGLHDLFRRGPVATGVE